SGTAVTSIAAHLHVRDDAYVPLLEAGCADISTISEKQQPKSFQSAGRLPPKQREKLIVRPFGRS
ncbi:hypothetical protein, partial [Bradyrhizobium sp. SZCCHNPS1003]|uniref:hypothetical protein n=1 Tax=Bradyrhizobium sp. SZCCHNPS1003 TaxID=3057330 RepID=UPI0028E56A13